MSADGYCRTEWQKAAREDLSGVRDEYESFAIVQTTRRAANGGGGLRRHHRNFGAGLSSGDPLLQKIPAIVLRLSRLGIEARGLGERIDGCEDLFELVGAQQVF